ncbi:Superkiller viralicidic activity 2-like [Perkinsus olseni]|uniref:Superkiller viralicidic activity 2-like n=2 Tax=Perkinsus olseni TaxID=32597 RepID=A0A7J6NG56_PEROL|nr:Superkiller viralicidic activity 2-like [Perkinsus olseni]
MLYRGSDVCREVKWVIFDEVHYMRDRDRGVVWEETMILLPDTVRFVFLSATIPNAREFAEWICRIKHQPCHLIYTDYRPVPLQHYVYPSMGDGVYLTVDEKGKFREDNYGKAVEILEKNTEQASQSTKGLKSNKKKQQQHTKNSDLLKVVRMCSDRAYMPVIVFAFSKKECEQNALVLRNIDLVTQDEKALIGDVFENAMATLSPEDRELQQIQSMLGFLSRGIGIHHGGLLPILKEIVEILFQENLIKVLFCTETFAMGVNMPAKTVVFTSIQKWDGIERRTLNSGEYIQMAGRAGRRGKDDKGLVIIMLTDKVEPNTAKDMFLGDASRLDSQFYLGYNMLLNMLRLEGVDPNYLLERSFSQFQKDKGCIAAKERHSELSHKLEDASEELNKVTSEASQKMNFDVKMALTDAFQADQDLASAVEERRKIVTLPKYAIPFMNPGRLISLSKDGDWAMVIKCDKLAEDKGAADLDNSYVVDCIDEEGVVRSVPLRSLHKISRIRGQLPQAAQEPHNRTEAVKTQCKNMLKAILNHDNFKAHGLPELDPVNEMKIDGEEFGEVSKKMKNAENAKLSNRLMTVPQAERSQLMDLFTKRVHLHEEQTKCADILKNQNTVILRDELRSMKRVLRRLGFVDRNNVVLEKGKLACEISSCDEILLTELVFNNVFEGMSAEHIAALCSCLILDEKSEDATTPDNADLAKALDKMKVIAQDVATVMAECKVAGVDTSTYVEDHIRPQLVPAVVAWMEGKPFKDIMQTCEMYEGSVVRVMRRLEELLRELGMAAKLIGHKELEEKMVEGRTKLRRGIVFSASLYL